MTFSFWIRMLFCIVNRKATIPRSILWSKTKLWCQRISKAGRRVARRNVYPVPPIVFVNKTHVRKYSNRGFLELVNNSKVPVSVRKREETRNNFWSLRWIAFTKRFIPNPHEFEMNPHRFPWISFSVFPNYFSNDLKTTPILFGWLVVFT